MPRYYLIITANCSQFIQIVPSSYPHKKIHSMTFWSFCWQVRYNIQMDMIYIKIYSGFTEQSLNFTSFFVYIFIKIPPSQFSTAEVSAFFSALNLTALHVFYLTNTTDAFSFSLKCFLLFWEFFFFFCYLTAKRKDLFLQTPSGSDIRLQPGADKKKHEKYKWSDFFLSLNDYLDNWNHDLSLVQWLQKWTCQQLKLVCSSMLGMSVISRYYKLKKDFIDPSK